MGRKWVLFTSIVFAILLFVFCYFLYFAWGGKFYFAALKSIRSLPKERQDEAELAFNLKEKYSHSGILMGVFKNVLPGVWIWESKGPRFFRTDEFSVFSYFRMCTPENLEGVSTNGSIKPMRSVIGDIKIWANEVKSGDFVTIRVTGPDNGGNLGRLREALAYDWWVFNPAIPINTQCDR